MHSFAISMFPVQCSANYKLTIHLYISLSVCRAACLTLSNPVTYPFLIHYIFNLHLGLGVWMDVCRHVFVCHLVSHPLFFSHINRSQGVWPAGSGAPGPVLQAGWADGHEATYLWVEKLEQCHLFAAGCSRQASRLHCSYLQPDVAHWHVDGAASHAQELWPQGSSLNFYEMFREVFKGHNK